MFIIPYTTTQSLKLSRFIFLTITLSMLAFNSISILKNQYRKFRANQNLPLKIHSVNGAMGFLSIVTLPITILLTSSNQFVVQTFYTSGFFIVSIDYFLYPLRNKIQQTPPLDIFSKREKEILYTFLLNSELTYPEISKKLFISDKTFSVHMSNIYKKAEVKGRKELYEKYKDCDIYSL
ncbi:LuxR C-terminal-related transcriptional regulator [Chryseobacterium sp. CT-SW4]|uniref:LuxR C-terminal-related transcriptional regulator n=1 Tax=Chryseobacterium sp. SW-1 TaxID=3157343 RepID=UPI003B0148A1